MYFQRKLLLLCIFVSSSVIALRCYEGTVALDSIDKTNEKECGGISTYCLQHIDKSKNVIKRSCSSFSDEHNMEERCPMTGCHWQSSKETFCCCQFDLCNEWKSDGTEFKAGETRKPSAISSKPRF
ncbi:unnamed protein product [Auanema sp. JU1783]|nr:unnamed protein product [Auanema sp. JU1783]